MFADGGRRRSIRTSIFVGFASDQWKVTSHLQAPCSPACCVQPLLANRQARHIPAASFAGRCSVVLLFYYSPGSLAVIACCAQSPNVGRCSGCAVTVRL